MTAASYGALPKISVLIVVRNAASTIGRALESLTVQHYPKLEVVIQDGASTDGTQEICARYTQLSPRIISEQDSGAPDAYNRALAASTGDYIGYLNADDEFEPGMLWAVAEAVLHDPSADMVSTGLLYRTRNRQGRRVVTGYYADERQLALTLENVLSDLPTFVLSRFIRREVAVKAGPYNTDRALWYIACDREWMTRLSLMNCRNVVIPRALYSFELHSRSISSNPHSYTRIIEEHLLITRHLLERTDLTEAQCSAIYRWQKRQFTFGFWKSLEQFKFGEAKSFLKRGIALGGWLFVPQAITVFFAKAIRMVGRTISGGIDGGHMPKA